MASGITDKLRQSYSRVVQPVQKTFNANNRRLLASSFSPQNRQAMVNNVVGAYKNWQAKPSNQIFNQLLTPQGQEQLTRTVSRNASYLPGGQVLSTPANYVNNRYLASIAQIPYSYNQFKQPGWRNKLQGGMGLLSGAATFLPDPIQDVAMPVYDFYKGANRAENRGKGFRTNLSSGLKSLSMESPTGIGDVITKDTRAQTALNMAEFGGMVLVPGMISKQRAKNLSGMSDELVRAKDLANANQLPNLNPTQWMNNKQYITQVFEKALPKIAKSKEMRKLAVSSPMEWHRVVSRFLEDAYVTSQNPGLDIGLSAKGLKRMDQTGAIKPDKFIPGKKPQSTVGGINNKTFYHGTTAKFDKFDNSKMGTSTDTGMFGKGFYFSDDYNMAKHYTRGTGEVKEVKLDLKNPYVINSKKDIPDIQVPNKTLNDMKNGAKNYSEAFTKYLKDRGYDGVIDNISPQRQYIVFDASQIKSKSPQPQSRVGEMKYGNKIVNKTEKELIGGFGGEIAKLQSRGAKIDNYQKLIERYEVSPTPELEAKIRQLEKSLGYTQSFVDMNNPTVAQAPKVNSDASLLDRQAPTKQDQKQKIRPSTEDPQPVNQVYQLGKKEALKTQPSQAQSQQLQTPTSTPSTPAPVSLPGEKVGSQISSTPIIQKQRKLNVNRLNLTDTQKQVVESLQDKTPNTVLANKSIIDKSKQTKGRTSIMSDEEMATRIASQLNSRQQVVTLTRQLDDAVKKGASEQERLKIMQQIAEASRVAKEEGTFAGRLLQARNIVANELATPMQKIFGLLDNAGVDESKYMKDAVKVDWNNSDQVVAFYRKYVPPKLGEVIDEYRYTNMLSSPQTQINNAASNFLQTAIVAPVEKTIAGGLDAVRSVLTGKERQYYARQGLDYSSGYIKALPDAWKNFKNVLTGSMPTTRPDLENIPVSTKKSYKLYTTPLRLLEASDQFFRTITIGGELKSLKRAGTTGDDAIKRASQNAEYRLFRQEFDPDGKLGENVVLRTWDKWNSAIMSLRRAPGGKWIVPFIKTPTNILKQGLEYSPAGIVTVPGAKRPIEQLSKTIIGSSVFATAYTLANSGLTTWDTPTNKKEREMFYAAGLQPYSVKIGNNWLSYSKLGPLAYPIAMAAALKHIETTKPDQKLPQDAAEWVTQMLGFFGDQSYVKSIGDFVSALQGDGNKLQSAIESQIANVAGQLVPYRSFLGWVARTIDPVYRDANTTYERIVSQIPGLSEGVPPYLTPSGEASQRDYPLLNAVSPFKISQEKPEAESMYRSMQQAGIQKGILKREKNKAEDQKRKEYGKVSAAENVDLPTTKDDLSVLYKDANRIIGNYQENKVKSQYGLVDKGIEEYQAEVDQAIAMKKRIERERPEMVFEIELDMYNKDSGSKVADRTKWIIKQLENSKDPNATIEKLYKGQVLTKSVIEELNEKYGFKLNKYNYGDGYRYTGGNGKKGKKAKKLISDAQILSAYKKAITAASKRPQSKKVASISNTTKPIKLKRSQVKMLY